MVKQVRPAVVRITVGRGDGTGFIFRVDGETAYVMTNHHVIAGYSTVTVRVRDETDYNGAVIDADSIRDLAVIRICCGNFRALPFADESEVVVGAGIVNIGYALGLSGQATVSTGIISAVRYDSHRAIDVIQTDAPINPGNSGGPMLTTDGKVLGINTYKYVSASIEGVGFALSGPHVKSLIPNLLSGQNVPADATPEGTPVVAPTILHGPLAGSMTLHREFLTIHMAYENHTGDMGMETTFQNPVAADSWYYGFIFARESGSAVLAMVMDDGFWAVSRWLRGRGHEIEGTGLIPAGALKTGNGARNHVKVIVEGDALTFYVNGQRALREADLSPFEISDGGDFGIFAGGSYPYQTDDDDRPVVWYERWQVWKP